MGKLCYGYQDPGQTNQRPNKLIEKIGFLTNYDSAVYVSWGCEHQKGELKWPQTFKTFHVLTPPG